MEGGVDTTVFAAFAAGFVSFISPCVLPLVPGYLSAVSGVSVTDIEEGRERRSAVLLPAVVFCLAFTAVFVALGMGATGLGSTLRDNRDTLEKVAGAFIVAMGAFFLLTPFVTRLNQEWHPNALMARAGAGGPLVAGAAFAVGWTPCIGPTLTAILAAAGAKEHVAEGGALLAIYSGGLAIPFLASAVAFQRATSVFRWLRDHYTVITVVSGAILIAMGVLIFTGELARLNIEAQQLLEKLGLDGLYNV
ncbi:MAG TPA: cytochrome c biogenesis protein CcdA [Solirubrobacteraceae bacterium]|nr:cytochrome c biogenesis protein CcdA [Solirubrobacteraceae bacterium]